MRDERDRESRKLAKKLGATPAWPKSVEGFYMGSV